VATASEDGTVRLWAVEGGRPLATLQGHTGAVVGVALSGDGALVASGGFDGTVRLWAAPSGQLLATLQGHTGAVVGVALSRDGEFVVSGSLDGTVRLWAAPSGQPLATLQGHTGGVRGVALAGDSALVASGSEDGTIKLWDVATFSLRRTLRPERRYERLDITGLAGVTAAQRATLQALGAVEQGQEQAAPPPPARVAYPTPPPVPPSAPGPPAQPVAAGAPAGLSNLPPARTTFVGRAAELARLMQAMDSAARTGSHLLTLTGVAGCGKTRLALEVAEAARDTYANGVWLVELAPLPTSPDADPTAVAAATLAALDLREQPGQAPLDTLRTHLQSRHVLLVLDNCEHVLAACAALATRLLGTCPGLCIVATSQRPLGIVVETLWPVAPLALPNPVTGAPTPEVLDVLGQSEAVQLFVARAQALQPGFVLSAANAAAVVAICRQLDGLPLAIELAVARLHMLPLDDILTRLDDRFRLLRQGTRAIDRHQTLEATMDWSYGLLDPTAQAVLRRLTVFAGGWDVAAAEAVGAGGEVEAETVLELLDELLERSLVYVHDAQGVPRYGLLETVRHYGLQQLEHTGEMSTVRERHLSWAVALVEQAAPALQGPEQASWLARLAREHDNLRAALQWALDRSHSALGLRLAGALGKFWLRGGHQREGRRWLAALLALPAEGAEEATVAVRATALDAAAWLAEDLHDFAQATALFEQGGALRRAAGQEEDAAGLLISAALEARSGGDYVRATTLLEEVLARHRALQRREGETRGGSERPLSDAHHYTILALVLREQGAYARARALCEEGLALSRERGDAEGIGVVLLSLADLARDQGDAPEVRAYCAESIDLFRELGHTWVGFVLNNLAQAAYLEGDLALAARQAEESEAVFRGLGAGPSLAEVLVTLGRVRGTQGEAMAAQAALSEALTLASAQGPRVVVAAALDELGVQAVRQGQAQHGGRLLSGAAALRQAMGTPVRPADRPALESALAAARACLGDRAFDAAWAAGHSLPVEQVVADALAGLRREDVC
jgi:non-specific serine/threonine protein kinase